MDIQHGLGTFQVSKGPEKHKHSLKTSLHLNQAEASCVTQVWGTLYGSLSPGDPLIPQLLSQTHTDTQILLTTLCQDFPYVCFYTMFLHNITDYTVHLQSSPKLYHHTSGKFWLKVTLIQPASFLCHARVKGHPDLCVITPQECISLNLSLSQEVVNLFPAKDLFQDREYTRDSCLSPGIIWCGLFLHFYSLSYVKEHKKNIAPSQDKITHKTS